MEPQNQTFTYTYSAKEHAEIKKIRQKYLPEEADKMEQLRRLDRSVTEKGTVFSLIVGIIGSLLLGVGLCCTIVWTGSLLIFAIGIVIGIIGIVIASFAYPLYKRIVRREREKIAPKIMRLTDELMK